MSDASQMLETHPRDFDLEAELLARCIDECFACSQACTACADACLGEESVAELVKCIRTNLDCADVCEATGRVLSRQTEYDPGVTRSIVAACAQACKSCGDECDTHAGHHEHCRVCADACDRCEKACNEVLQAIGA